VLTGVRQLTRISPSVVSFDHKIPDRTGTGATSHIPQHHTSLTGSSITQALLEHHTSLTPAGPGVRSVGVAASWLPKGSTMQLVDTYSWNYSRKSTTVWSDLGSRMLTAIISLPSVRLGSKIIPNSRIFVTNGGHAATTRGGG